MLDWCFLLGLAGHSREGSIPSLPFRHGSVHKTVSKEPTVSGAIKINVRQLIHKFVAGIAQWDNEVWHGSKPFQCAIILAPDQDHIKRLYF